MEYAIDGIVCQADVDVNFGREVVVCAQDQGAEPGDSVRACASEGGLSLKNRLVTKATL